MHVSTMPSRKKSSNQKQPLKPHEAIAVKKPLKTADHSPSPSLPLSLSKQVPIQLQQLLLNIFKNTFAPRFDSGFPAVVQQIKQHLFNRDFKSAFDQDSFLEVYAMRWSPSRALAYTQIFWQIMSNHLLESASLEQDSRELPVAVSTKPVVCLGGGAGAELVALGACLQMIDDPCADLTDPEDNFGGSRPRFAIRSIDVADWSIILKRLHSSMTAAPPISEYSSAAAKAANVALTSPTACTLTIMQEDILRMDKEDLAIALTDAVLVTLMFTLNELYNLSVSSTTNLLFSLTMLLAPGALLLVVDSPGSYSAVEFGETSGSDISGGRKSYPMQWLLDHTLLESAAIGAGKDASAERQWEKLESKDSEWFRLSSELRYPVTLEDMRYQLHLYRRL